MAALDHQAFLNALHVPEDADEWEEGLRKILGRIPDGWGRWISCDKGWYPIVVELDEQLSRIAPDYAVHQVKEKFGGLRYYYSLNQGQAEEGDERAARAERLSRLAEQVVSQAERQAAKTCETCGAEGVLCRTPGRWYKTLCPDCAGDRYAIVKKRRAGREQEEPRSG